MIPYATIIKKETSKIVLFFANNVPIMRRFALFAIITRSDAGKNR